MPLKNVLNWESTWLPREIIWCVSGKFRYGDCVVVLLVALTPIDMRLEVFMAEKIHVEVFGP
jgi:hypothetical protein